ncbi:hypothetical protein D3C71_1889840 [compost metagenome]
MVRCRERGPQLRECAEIQPRQIPGIVLQLPDLVVDLLQRARSRQDVLREIGRVDHDPLRVRYGHAADQRGGGKG